MFRATPADGAVWITGASAGLGRALALQFAARGFRVAATARRAEALAQLVEAGQGRINAYPVDVTDAALMKKVVATVEADLGPLAIAVLNAGNYHPAERDGFDAQIAWQTIDTNLGGAVRCLDPALAAMLPRGRGQIALVASLAGYGGVPGSAAYGAAKSAIITLAEALHLTYRSAGVTIQVVNPGFVDTAMTAQNDYAMPFMMSAEKAAARIISGMASQRFEITFPRRLAWTMKAASLLPYPLWLAVMASATRRIKRSPTISVNVER